MYYVKEAICSFLKKTKNVLLELSGLIDYLFCILLIIYLIIYKIIDEFQINCEF